MPNLYMIAGPNGAGKTTSAYTLLPSLHIIEFVNADNIARGISPYNPEDVAIQAGRVMLQRIDELVKDGKDFALETTLSTLSYKGLINNCKEKGYDIVLIYVWLTSPELAKQRVQERVARGGHNIPQETIERRYHKGIINLKKIFLPLCDTWLIVDNSSSQFVVVAEYSNGETKITDNEKYKRIIND